MRRRAMTESLPSPTDSLSRIQPPALYSHVSTYRSSPIELQLHSPSLRVDARGPLAVFNDHDELSGKVMLDSHAHHTGRLVIAIEGCFLYAQSGASPFDEPRKHVFCSTKHTINVAPPVPGSSRFTFREAFMRRPSASYLSTGKPALLERSFPFQIPLPQTSQPGQELPPSFNSSMTEGNPLVATCEISYKVVASWFPDSSMHMSAHLEVPIVIEAEGDFQSKDAALGPSGNAWAEMPLKTERPIGLKCAIALPSSVTFCRQSSSIPYFVVFSTAPRCPLVAREIAADATISIQLVRQIVVQQRQMTFPLTPPPSPTKEKDSGSSPVRMLRRVAKSNPRLKRKRSEFEEEFRDKPLPALPLRTCFSETKTVYSNFIIGFSKRPRHACEPAAHPSLEEQSSLPDGLHKGKIPLHKEMLPCVDWEGVSVKYYLDISVLVGVDDLRARIPVRLF